MSELRRALLLLLFVPALALAAEHFRAQAQSHYISTQRYLDAYYLPPPDYLVTLSLGYRETAADLVWLKALVYFGEEIAHRGGVSNLYRYTDAMLTLDPHFKKVYRWVASTSIYRTGDVTAADVNKAIAYLTRGARLFPDDGDLAWELGATYTFELPPLLTDKREIDEARRKGLEYLEIASLRGAGPAWLALQTAGQLNHLGKTEQAVQHLEDVYATTSDPDAKAQIEARIAQLRSSAYAEALRRTNEELTAQRQASYPYLSDTLYLQVGPRPPFDGVALLMRGFDPVAARATQDPAPATSSD